MDILSVCVLQVVTMVAGEQHRNNNPHGATHALAPATPTSSRCAATPSSLRAGEKDAVIERLQREITRLKSSRQQGSSASASASAIPAVNMASSQQGQRDRGSGGLLREGSTSRGGVVTPTPASSRAGVAGGSSRGTLLSSSGQSLIHTHNNRGAAPSSSSISSISSSRDFIPPILVGQRQDGRQCTPYQRRAASDLAER